ncbi:hypothetical protein AB6A40_000422 [Gnathostoma spinigerum]|uniref:Uncharacterized protein n=1 Tax=Gnathostoma spinigerum TaxID=75299 RepID=A0ABD6E257_9BILA
MEVVVGVVVVVVGGGGGSGAGGGGCGGGGGIVVVVVDGGGGRTIVVVIVVVGGGGGDDGGIGGVLDRSGGGVGGICNGGGVNSVGLENSGDVGVGGVSFVGFGVGGESSVAVGCESEILGIGDVGDGFCDGRRGDDDRSARCPIVEFSSSTLEVTSSVVGKFSSFPVVFTLRLPLMASDGRDDLLLVSCKRCFGRILHGSSDSTLWPPRATFIDLLNGVDDKFSP